MSPAILRQTARRLAMRAGSWFDRRDLPLQTREDAVAALALREVGRLLRTTREAPQDNQSQTLMALADELAGVADPAEILKQVRAELAAGHDIVLTNADARLLLEACR